MAEPFIGEIKMVGFNFAPRHWADCHGQKMSIDQNQALYVLIGDAFGGDRVRTFYLPDMRGRTPIHPGGYMTQGFKWGVETVQLDPTTYPEHTHAVRQSAQNADHGVPSSPTFPNRAFGKAQVNIYGNPTNLTKLHSNTITPDNGGGLAHNNVQPSTVIRFIIALEGQFPPRH